MKTPKLQNILVPTDFSKTSLLAIEHAVFMAKLTRSDLYLLHAVELISSPYDAYAGIALMDYAAIEKDATEQLLSLCNKISKEHRIKVKAISKTGSPSYQITEAVNEFSIDIVVMGTHGAKGFNEYFIGSNAYRTVSQCPCPVITIQTTAKKIGFTSIVLSIDDCFDSRQKVDFTLALAKYYAAKVHILGLISKKEHTDPLKFRIKIEAVEKAAEKAGLSYDTKIMKSDNMALSTLNYSQKLKANLVSVLNDHESKLSGGFLGLFAQQLVNHSKIPVLTMRPKDLGIYDSISLAGSNSN